MSNSKSNNQKISKSDLIAWKWVYGICRAERFKILVIIVTYVISASLTVLFANYSMNIINSAVEDKSLERVLHYAICYLGLIMLQLALNLISRSFTERCKGKIEWHLKQYMLETVMHKDYASVTAYHSGELQNRMFNDVTIISDGFTTILPNVVFFVVKLTCAFGYLIFIDKIFALVFLVGGLFVFFCTRMFRKTLKTLHKAVQETEGKTRSFIQEALTSLLVIKAFVVEDKIADDANEYQAVNYKTKMKRRFFGIAANAGITFTFNLGYVFALAFGAYRLLNGMSFGAVTAMLELVNQIQSPFANLSGLIPRYFSVVASAERLMEIEALPNENAVFSDDFNAKQVYNSLKSIQFDNISFKYDRDMILQDTSLTVNKGDFIAIMGISGIGKSTLLKLLLGVFTVDDGDIYIRLDNENDRIKVDAHTRRLFSYVPQGNFLLSGSIKDNLRFINNSATDEEINEAIRISCADRFIDELPDGIDTIIGERGIGLSEGQLQRLAIARSLLSNSPILLLDEATSALDEQTEKRFLTNLKELKNKTCIIVSHKMAALEICNKHVQIVDSKIVMEENNAIN